MNLTPIESQTDWMLMGVLIVVFLAIAGLIWWNRRTPTEAQKELKVITDEIKGLLTKVNAAPAPTPPVDPLVYKGIKFATAEELTAYMAAEVTLHKYKP